MWCMFYLIRSYTTLHIIQYHCIPQKTFFFSVSSPHIRFGTINISYGASCWKIFAVYYDFRLDICFIILLMLSNIIWTRIGFIITTLGHSRIFSYNVTISLTLHVRFRNVTMSELHVIITFWTALSNKEPKSGLVKSGISWKIENF